MKITIRSMLIKTKLLYISFFLIIASKCFPQGYTIDHYTMLNGLPSNDLKNITIDSKGFLWSLTNNGLCRYDGNRFKYFSPDEKLYNGYSMNSNDGIPMSTNLDQRGLRGLPDGSIIFQTEDSTYTFRNWSYHKIAADTAAKKIYDYKKNVTYISAGAMDKEGNEWNFFDHVYCFDGKKTKIFGTKEGLCEDSLIVQGLSFFKGFTKYTYNTVNIDNKGTPWIFGKKAAYKFNGKTFDKLNFALAYNCQAVFEDSKGRVWFETMRSNQLHCWANGKLTTYDISHLGELNFYGEITEDADGKIYFSSNKGVFMFDKTTFSFVEALKEYNFPYIEIDKSNNLILASSTRGVIIYSGEKVIKIKELQNIIVRQVIVDDENNYWIATSEGLYKIRLGPVFNFNVFEKLGAGGSKYFKLIDKKDRIWIESNHTSYRYDGDTLVKIKEFENGFANIYMANDGEIYFIPVGFGKKTPIYGIFKYNDNDGSVKEIRTPAIKALCNNEKMGNYAPIFAWGEHELAITIPDEGIYLFDGKDVRKVISYTKKTHTQEMEDGTLLTYDDSVLQELNLSTKKAKTIFAIPDLTDVIVTDRVIYDRNQNLWGYDYKKNAIVRYSSKGITTYGVKDSLIRFKKLIVCKAIDPKRENIYFITDLGITKLHIDGNNTITSTFAPSKIFKGYYSYTFAKDGNLWICNEDGIMAIDTKDITKPIKVYNLLNGMFDIYCYQVFEDSKNNIWSYTQKGYVKIDTKGDFKNRKEPKVYINALRLFYEDFNYSDYTDSINASSELPEKMILPYSKNHLTFDFTAICYVQSDDVRYKFMLEGYDTDWQSQTTMRSATYSNLPPGDYTFKLLACNNDQVWIKEPVTFSFHINTPWYANRWAYGGYVIGFLSIIFGFNGVRTRQLKLRQNELEKTVLERTEEVVKQKEVIEEKQKEILDSIHYAKRIQSALITNENYIDKHLKRLMKK